MTEGIEDACKRDNEMDSEESEAEFPRLPLSVMAMQAGISTKVAVLYLPDNVHHSVRTAQTSAAWRALSVMLPEHDISVSLAPAPFQNDAGYTRYFDPEFKKVARRSWPGSRPEKRYFY